MSKSLIQTANPSEQTVAENGIISPGAVQRRFGCNCFLSGNAVQLHGTGYYEADAAVTFTNATVGPVAFALYQDGQQVPGAIAVGTVGAANEFTTLPVFATVRLCFCNCDTANLTLVMLQNSATVTNVSLRVVRA